MVAVLCGAANTPAGGGATVFFRKTGRHFPTPFSRKNSIYWIMATVDTPVTPGSGVEATAAPPPGDEDPESRNRQRAAVLAFGRRIHTRPSLTALTQDAIALVADVLQAELGGASQVVAGGEALLLRVVSSLMDAQPIEPAVSSSSLRAEESMAGFALAAGTAVASGDVTAETRFCDLALRKLGVRAALTAPLGQDKEPFGTLGVYRRRPQPFSTSDTQFVEMIGHLLMVAIARIRADEALQQNRNFTAALLEAVESLVIVLDLEGRIVDINPACRQTTGFVLEQVRQRPFVSVFAAPEDLDLFHGTLRKAVRDRAALKFDGNLMTKDGQRLRVAWSLRFTCDAEGKPQLLLLSGVPCFDQATQSLQMRPTPGGKELRASPRRTFQYRQMIAPVTDGSMPLAGDFFEVDCCDISAGGLSFFLDRVPDFDKLIVALGKPPAVTHFAAQVARYAEKVNNGQRQFLIGCRFLGRTQL